VLLSDIADKLFYRLRSMYRSMVCLWVCHVRVLCSNGRRYQQ